MSLATREDLAGFRFGHSKDVLKLHEVIQLCLFVRRQTVLFFALDQGSGSLFGLRRRTEMANRFGGRARRDGSR